MALSRYIALAKIPEPKHVTLGKMKIHIWSEEEIQNVKNLLPKIKNGRKTRYQTKKGKIQKPQPREAVPHKKTGKKK